MTRGGQTIRGFRRDGRPLLALALAVALVAAIPTVVSAQMFSDRPPPIPPAPVRDPPAGPAMNLAPPSGPASIPNLPAPLTQPSIVAVPPVVAPQGAAAPNQAVLALTARFGKDLPQISNGLVWRVVCPRPARSAAFRTPSREPAIDRPDPVRPPPRWGYR